MAADFHTSPITFPNAVHTSNPFNPHKHLPRRSLPLIVAEALQLKFEIDQRNQWPATRSTFNSSQRPLALSELPCFTHRASQTPGDTDVVEPRCLRDHCFRSYVRLSAGSTGGRLRAQKTSQTFQPSGFLLWLAVASAYNDDGRSKIFFAGFPLFFSKFFQSGQLLGERWGGAWHVAGLGEAMKRWRRTPQMRRGRL